MDSLHKNFAAGLSDLNLKTSGHSIITRADGTRQLYGGPIHVGVVAENTLRHTEYMDRVSKDASLMNGLHAGAAGFVNMGYIAHSRANAALLFDINAYQTLFWNIVIQKIADNEKAQDFRSALTTLPAEIEARAAKQFPLRLRELFHQSCNAWKQGSIFKDPAQDDFQRWVNGRDYSPDTKWMHDDVLYAHLHALAKNNAIGAVTLDITSTAACAAVKDYLKEHHTAARILYVSNILNFMQSPVRKTDFIGRDVSDTMRAAAEKNVYRWMEKNGHIIECDNLERNTPLFISAQSYNRPALRA